MGVANNPLRVCATRFLAVQKASHLHHHRTASRCRHLSTPGSFCLARETTFSHARYIVCVQLLSALFLKNMDGALLDGIENGISINNIKRWEADMAGLSSSVKRISGGVVCGMISIKRQGDARARASAHSVRGVTRFVHRGVNNR